MATEVRMPRLSWTMVEGVIQEWLKPEGASIAQGEPLLTVESDKSVSEIEACASGTLLKIVRSAGETVEVDEIIAYIGLPGEAIVTPTDERTVERPDVSRRKADTEVEVPASRPQRTLASPAARRLAMERGVDISRIVGSGPGGTVVEKDVLAYVEGLTHSPLAARSDYGEVTDTLLSPVQRAMSERMLASKQETVQGTTFAEVDMTAALEIRKRIRASVTAMVARAVVMALLERPTINSSLRGNRLRTHGYVNLGVAVATDRGLIVPVVHNAEQLSVDALSNVIDDLAARVRVGSLAARETSEGTFTITNSGALGALAFIPIVNYPENAILGMGKIMETAVVRDGAIVVRQMMILAVSYNHRVIDGATAVSFLQRVKALLENPHEIT